MAVDMFLIFEGDIDGESTDAQYAGEDAIDLLAWSWGMSQPGGDAAPGSGRRRGHVSFQNISFTKYLDSASTDLMLHCSLGKHVPSARLIVRAGGENGIEVLVIDMTDVLVTSLSTGGSSGEDRLTENVTLGFGKVQVTYREQRPDGAVGEKHMFGWDLAASRPV